MHRGLYSLGSPPSYFTLPWAPWLVLGSLCPRIMLMGPGPIPLFVVSLVKLNTSFSGVYSGTKSYSLLGSIVHTGTLVSLTLPLLRLHGFQFLDKDEFEGEWSDWSCHWGMGGYFS